MTKSNILPDKNYRENPNRAIYIDDAIDHPLLTKVMRKYHKLRAKSNDPITVYISSPGGNVKVFEWIKDVFWTPDQNGDRPRIITVAKGMAASAAARLLIFGDYSICYPSALIHCHGTRLPSVDEVTREMADAISRNMEDSNKATADEFNLRIIENLAFLIDSNRSAIEEKAKEKGCHLIQAFAAFIFHNLSANAAEVMHAVFDDLNEIDQLKKYLSEAKIDAELRNEETDVVQKEAILLKGIIDFLVISRWHAEPRLNYQFSHDLKRLFSTWQNYQLSSAKPDYAFILPFLLSPTEYEEFQNAETEGNLEEFLTTNIAPLIIPLWQLASSISHRLVRGENPLSGSDAYWLGLVQEVLGSGLPCIRHIAEEMPDKLSSETASS